MSRVMLRLRWEVVTAVRFDGRFAQPAEKSVLEEDAVEDQDEMVAKV